MALKRKLVEWSDADVFYITKSLIRFLKQNHMKKAHYLKGYMSTGVIDLRTGHKLYVRKIVDKPEYTLSVMDGIETISRVKVGGGVDEMKGKLKQVLRIKL